jgi:Asp-tRNA(Asn)/Glu-tRNA(Gln) amidotransferase A subunit family amidase
LTTATPGSHTFACAGPFGKSAFDVAAILSAIARPATDYTPFTQLPYNDISRYRIGVVRDGYEPAIDTGLVEEKTMAFEQALELLGGSIVADSVALPGVADMWLDTKWDITGRTQDWVINYIFKVEGWQAYIDYLSTTSESHFKTLEDIVKWHNEHPVRACIFRMPRS